MGVCGVEDAVVVDVTVLGVARIDMYEVKLWCAFIHPLGDPMDSNLTIIITMVYTKAMWHIWRQCMLWSRKGQ
jgi:hypothetical protein